MACLLCGSFGNEEDLILIRNRFSPSHPNNALNEEGSEKAVSLGRCMCHLLNLPEEPYVQAFLRSEISYCHQCTQIVKTVRDLFVQLDEIQCRISEYRDAMQEQLLRSKENMKFHPITVTAQLRDNILEEMCLLNGVQNEDSAPQLCGTDSEGLKLETRTNPSSGAGAEADTNSNCEIETTIITEFMDPFSQLPILDPSSLGLTFQAVQTADPESLRCNDCGHFSHDIDSYVQHVRQHFKSEQPLKPTPKKSKKTKAKTETETTPKKSKKSKPGTGTNLCPKEPKKSKSGTGNDLSPKEPAKPETETGTTTPKKPKKSKKKTETNTGEVPSEGQAQTKIQKKSDLPRPKKEYMCRFCGKMLSKPSTLKKHEMFQHKDISTPQLKETGTPQTHVQQTVTTSQSLLQGTVAPQSQLNETVTPPLQEMVTPGVTKMVTPHLSETVTPQIQKTATPCVTKIVTPHPHLNELVALHFKEMATPQVQETLTPKPESTITTATTTKADLPKLELSHVFPLHKCSICSWAFITAQFLDDHIKSAHQDLYCRICEIYLPSADDLKKHTDVRHGPQIIKCSRCWFQCSNSAEFQAHFQHCFIPVPLFFCEPCGVRFWDNETFQSHVEGHSPKAEQTKCESVSVQSPNLTSL